MIRIKLVILLSVFYIGLSGQGRHETNKPARDCESFPGLIDSLYAYDWDTINSKWKLVSIRHYLSSDGQYDRLLFLKADRTPERAWDYYYDSNGNRNLEMSSFYRNSVWYTNFKKESEFDSENNKLNELRQTYKNNAYIFHSYYYYEYLNNKIDKVHTQLKDSNGNLYDQSWTEYTYNNDKVTKVIGYDGITGVATGSDQYFYDAITGKVKEVVTSGIINESNSGTLVPVKKRLYKYDPYSLLREELFQEMRNEQWTTYHKYIFYYKLDNASKVTVCHNNHSLCISVNALKAHLAHGDKLGYCSSDPFCDHEGNRNNNRENRGNPFTLYPVPSIDRVNLKIDRSIDSEISGVSLIDQSGKVHRTYKVDDIENLEILRGNLKKGQYFLIITGRETYSAGVTFR